MFLTGWFLVAVVLAWYSRLYGIDWALWLVFAGLVFLDLAILGAVLRALGRGTGCALHSVASSSSPPPHAKRWSRL